jgi:L-alanine-DL-glutamate epimerase-like enolase superfamily enzyme
LGASAITHESITRPIAVMTARSSASGMSVRIAPISCVDVALWDAVGQHLGLPLYRLWGGHRDKVPAYASGLNLHLDGDGLAEQLSGYLERGYRAVKVEVGRPDIEVDVERIAQARKTIGASIEMYLDANQTWQASDAIRRIRRLEQFSPSWIEEPVLAEDTAGNARVRAGIGTPVALGESLFSRYQYADVIRAGAVDIVQADVARVGGFSEWLKIAHLAGAHNLKMAPHFVSELSVHALCAVDNGLVLEDIEGGTLAELGLATEPLRIIDGMAHPPNRPGHGVVFDEAAIERSRVTGSFAVVPTRRD